MEGGGSNEKKTLHSYSPTRDTKVICFHRKHSISLTRRAVRRASDSVTLTVGNPPGFRCRAQRTQR